MGPARYNVLAHKQSQRLFPANTIISRKDPAEGNSDGTMKSRKDFAEGFRGRIPEGSVFFLAHKRSFFGGVLLQIFSRKDLTYIFAEGSAERFPGRISGPKPCPEGFRKDSGRIRKDFPMIPHNLSPQSDF